MDFINKYNEINNSFKKSCIFRVGDSQGFFSELNNMIFAMIYCLQNKIKFVLYSKNANFAPKNGWEEFFLPFCEQSQIRNKYFQQLNIRLKPKLNELKLIRKIKYLFIILVNKLSKTKLTFDIFDEFVFKEFLPQQIVFEELEVHGDNTVEASKKFAEMVWRFNDKTQNEINKKIQELNLPHTYVSIHIRGGDKFFKSEYSNSDIYIQKLKEITTIKDVYIFTDDYRYILEFKEKCPDWNIYTLCREDEKGYMNENFNQKSWAEKKEGILNLFTSIEIAKKSVHFLGITASNPDLFLRMIMDKEKFHTIDEIPSYMTDKKLFKEKFNK